MYVSHLVERDDIGLASWLAARGDKVAARAAWDVPAAVAMGPVILGFIL